MIVNNAKKPAVSSCLGIDCSTKSLAFACFADDHPLYCGEIDFSGASVFERLNDARTKTQGLIDRGFLVADFVAIEAAVAVTNVQTAIKLAYVYGAVMSVLMQNKSNVYEIAPLTWQSAIGNPILKKGEKAEIEAEYPGMSKTWYKAKGREIRKARTLSFARKFFDIDDGSDNVGDAVGIAWHAAHDLTRRLK